MKQYFVYVIELDPAVADLRKFRAKNPKYISGNSCLYVGQSSRKPSLRFEQHKEGISQTNLQSIMVLTLDQTSMRSITQFQPEKTLKKLKRC